MGGDRPGLAKVESPAIEAGVEAEGLPAPFVGVVHLVLLAAFVFLAINP